MIYMIRVIGGITYSRSELCLIFFGKFFRPIVTILLSDKLSIVRFIRITSIDSFQKRDISNISCFFRDTCKESIYIYAWMLRHIAWKTISFPLFPIFFLFSIEKTQCSHFIAYRIVKSNISDSCISLDHSILIWRAARIPEKAGHMFSYVCTRAISMDITIVLTNSFI